MDYCAPLGLPHSKFLAWPHRDQDLAIAWQLKRREVCPDCGTKERDWIDEDGKYLDQPKYKIVDHRCPGCKEQASYQEHLQSDDRSDLRGVHLSFALNEVEDA